MASLWRRLAAEFLGTLFLLATVVGSGIMAERLAGGNMAIALLVNAIATGAILYVLISALGPVSGAHFNPVVTLVMRARRELSTRDALLYFPCQMVAAIAGVWLAHAMFDLPMMELGVKTRSGYGQWLSEIVATCGLVLVILGNRKTETVAAAVALYITAAYWFTASTSFANPAVTLARSLTNSFAGIAPADVPMFIGAQLLGGIIGGFVGSRLFTATRPNS